jgi:O-antigen/teichoic acid export membrane protein
LRAAPAFQGLACSILDVRPALSDGANIQNRETPRRAAVLRLFSTAILDQMLLSAGNLLCGFILIRYTSDFAYGLYVLVQSGTLLVVSSQGSWTAGPLSVMASRKTPEERRATIGAVTLGQARVVRILALVALVVPAGGYLLGYISGLMALVLGCAIVSAWGAMRRDHLRNVLLIYSKPHDLLRADAFYVGILFTGILLASFATNQPIVWATVALAAAGWAGTSSAYRSFAADPGWVAGDGAAAWRELRSFGVWSLLGGAIYWLFGQSYSYVLASRLDLKAVADVNASRLLLMPAFVVAVGIQGLLQPTAARWKVELGFRGLLRRLLLVLLLVGCADILYFGVVWILRDWLTGDLLHKNIGNRDGLLLLWAAVALIGLIRDILQCSLIAVGRFKSMAGQVAISAVVALVLMWFGTPWWGPAAVLIGQIAGELVNVAGIMWLVRIQAKSESSSIATAAG